MASPDRSNLQERVALKKVLSSLPEHITEAQLRPAAARTGFSLEASEEAGGSHSIGLPFRSVSWLSALPEDLSRYGELMDRNGFETTFALGFIDSADELTALGVWQDDAEMIVRHLQAPRRLVAYWTPMIQRMPVMTTVNVFLEACPVPALAYYTPRLESKGFDSLATLRHMTLEDAKSMKMKDGHALALTHIANNISVEQEPPPVDTPLVDWLMHLNPSLEHYSLTLELEGVTKPMDLKKLTEPQWDRLLMKLGHKRTLRYYAIRLRTYWYDPL
jgi:hypothetical protein